VGGGPVVPFALSFISEDAFSKKIILPGGDRRQILDWARL
jgi:hypothetical protein